MMNTRVKPPHSPPARGYALVIANRILPNEGILDAFGHVSVRHPDDPGRFLLSRHRAPELVEPSDILEFTLHAEPVKPTNPAPLGRARDPRLHLPAAARRGRGVPSSRARRAALLRRQEAAGSG